MTFRRLIFRSLRFHARSHAGVLIGAAIASAVLIGALLVGDSMRQSLRARALGRLGWVHYALAPQDRFFSTRLLSLYYYFAAGSAIPATPYPSRACAALN